MGSRFTVLGRTRLLIDGRFDDGWGAPKLRGMLGVLLLNPGRDVRIGELVDWLWPDGSGPKDPAATLHKYASRIGEALRRMADPPRLARGRGVWRIEVDSRDVDVWEFRDLVERARMSSQQGDHRAAVGTLLSALDMWGNNPLADLDGDEAQRWRDWAMQDVWLPAQDDLMRELCALGEFRDVLHRLDALPREYQTDLTVVRRRLEAMHGLHRSKESHTYFMRMYRRMINDGEHAAAEELTRFNDKLMRRDRLGATVDADNPGVSTDPAPRVPHLLPHDIHDFVGRTELLDELDRATAPESGTPATIITLGGEPGVGKTAIAVHWAHRAAHRFPGGQLFLDLHGAGDSPRVEPETVVDRFLRAVDFPVDRIPTAEGRAAKLRSLLSGRRAVVVLDNAANSEHVLGLLDHLPCPVLVTSHKHLSGLARRGARHLFVPPLSHPDSRTWLAGRIGTRVANDPGALTELAGLCGGNALMLSVVAAHVVHRPRVPLAEFVDELRDERTLLGLGADPDSPDGSVFAAFANAYRVLDEPARRMFRLLGVHPGPDVSRTAAAAIAGLEPELAKQVLDGLVHAYLLTQPDARERYRLHDLTRKFAAQCIAAPEHSDERSAAEQRMLNYYHHSANNADMTVFPHRAMVDMPALMDGVYPSQFIDEPTAIRWCARERANLNAVIRYAALRSFHDYTTGLTASIGELYQRLGYFEDVTQALKLALESARETRDADSLAFTHNNLGFWHLSMHDLDTAERHLHIAQQFYEEAGDTIGIGVAIHNLARVQVERGEYRRGIQGLTDARRVFQDAGARGHEVHSLLRLAEAYRTVHDPDRAIAYAQEGNWLAGQIADQTNQAVCLTELALAYYDKGDRHSSRGFAERALVIHQRLNSFTQAARTSALLAGICQDERDMAGAEEHARRAADCHRSGRDARGEAAAHVLLAEIVYAQARHDEAIEHWSRALAIYADIGDRRANAVRQRLAEVSTALPITPPEQTTPLAVRPSGHPLRH